MGLARFITPLCAASDRPRHPAPGDGGAGDELLAIAVRVEHRTLGERRLDALLRRHYRQAEGAEAAGISAEEDGRAFLEHVVVGIRNQTDVLIGETVTAIDEVVV